MSESRKQSFRDLQPERRNGVVREFYLLIRHNKKYWMLPLLIIFLLVGLLVITAGSSSAPFIYRLF